MAILWIYTLPCIIRLPTFKATLTGKLLKWVVSGWSVISTPILKMKLSFHRPFLYWTSQYWSYPEKKCLNILSSHKRVAYEGYQLKGLAFLHNQWCFLDPLFFWLDNIFQENLNINKFKIYVWPGLDNDLWCTNVKPFL